MWPQVQPLAVMHQSIPGAPMQPPPPPPTSAPGANCQANTRALAFFVTDDKFLGVGTKKEGKCPTPWISLYMF